MEKITLSPVTRISGLLSVDVILNQSMVVEANCSGEQFRGFEVMMRGRHITDSVYFTQRICGICSMAHGYTAARLVEKVYGITTPSEAKLLQQIMLGTEFLQNHLRHFYLLALPDYLDSHLFTGGSGQNEPSRFNLQQQQLLMNHYFGAMEYSRKCHEMLAIFGGKIPHQHGLVAGGVTVAPDSENIAQFRSLLIQVREFIRSCLLPDTYLLAEVYHDYYNIGTRPARFLSYGLFDPNLGEHFPSGVYNQGILLPLQIEIILESIAYSWYSRSPDGQETPDPEKPEAYSWVKAPRYQGLSFESGPLARKIIKSDASYELSTGAMARIVARSEEAALIASWIRDWLDELPLKGTYYIPPTTLVTTTATQTCDAPRGALLHAIDAQDQTVRSYRVITPTTWNFSPKDDLGRPGPAEESLLKTVLNNREAPVEVGRVIRAFDPCLSCGAHLIDQNKDFKMKVNLQI